MIKAPDIYVLAGVLSRPEGWTYRSLAADLHVPHATLQRGFDRAERAGLYDPDHKMVHAPSFEEFAAHAIRFVVPAELGALVPGVPAAWAADPMARKIRSSSEEPPPVWPHERGRVRGQALEPLHRAAPSAVRGWAELGAWLAVLDSLRAGDPRVRSVAEALCHEFLTVAAQ